MEYRQTLWKCGLKKLLSSHRRYRRMERIKKFGSITINHCDVIGEYVSTTRKIDPLRVYVCYYILSLSIYERIVLGTFIDLLPTRMLPLNCFV